MLSIRPLLLASCAGSLFAAGCGGGSGDVNNVVPEGTHHSYVVSKATAVPALGHSSGEVSLDLGTSKSSKPDGRLENKLSDLLVFLTSLNSALDVQSTIDTAVNSASIILLLDFQAKDFTNSNAGLTMKFGTNPNPPACTDQNDDTTCGQHLKGGASFQVASGSPSDEALAGKLEGGTFNGGPGDLTLAIAIGTTDPIVLPLVHARARATGISETGMSAIIGGLLTVADLRSGVGTALEGSVEVYLASSCTDRINPPGCGCNSTATTLLQVADGSAGTAPDCKLSVDEVLGNSVIGPLLAPDSCSMDTCTAPDAISVGLKIDAVSATF
jgi:hypothetical protein